MTSYLQAPKAGAVLVSITLSHFFSCQQKVFHPLFKLFSVLKINMKHIMHRRKLSLVFTRQKEKKLNMSLRQQENELLLLMWFTKKNLSFNDFLLNYSFYYYLI